MIDRRRTIQATAVGVFGNVSGCARLLSNTVPVEIGVINNRPETHLVTVEITDLDDTVLFETDLEVRPSGSAHREEPYHPSTTVTDLFADGEEYRLRATIEGGDSASTRVTVDCGTDDGEEGWGIRLRSGGGILVHDSSC